MRSLFLIGILKCFLWAVPGGFERQFSKDHMSLNPWKYIDSQNWRLEGSGNAWWGLQWDGKGSVPYKSDTHLIHIWYTFCRDKFRGNIASSLKSQGHTVTTVVSVHISLIPCCFIFHIHPVYSQSWYQYVLRTTQLLPINLVSGIPYWVLISIMALFFLTECLFCSQVYIGTLIE